MKKFDVVGIGNAVVDIVCHVEEPFLSDHRVSKGIMQLIDLDRATELYSLMSSAKRTAGGSAANTIAALASLGRSTAYIGKVKADSLGEFFVSDMRSLGAAFNTPLAPTQTKFETGRCMVLVTPDGERSMNTYLGASEFLSSADIDEEIIAASEWIFLEGYRFDGPESQNAFRDAITRCRRAGGKIALTLSDPFCVLRHRRAFRDLIENKLDLLVCNRAELLAMYQTANLDEALRKASQDIGMVACTVGKDGVFVAAEGSKIQCDAVPTQIVDATGAGDFFAAGFLYGLVSGRDLLTAARMGCLAASEVIRHLGARPEMDLRKLFFNNDLLNC